VIILRFFPLSPKVKKRIFRLFRNPILFNNSLIFPTGYEDDPPPPDGRQPAKEHPPDPFFYSSFF
jgi:hypothetical protein